jgi:peptide deformylase
MILPVVAYGHPVLRKICTDITPDYPSLSQLIADMWETMYNSNGMGLAAPQINKAIRLFVIDTEQVYDKTDDESREEFKGEEGFKKVFINAHILELNGEPWTCEEVSRESEVVLAYCDEQFNKKIETFKGLNARVILHEYDHIDGKLFIDHLPLIKKKLLKKKLDDITAGRVKPGYKMLFPK